MGQPTVLSLAIAAVTLAGTGLGLWLGFGVVGITIGAIGVFAALAVPHVLALRFGGVTGDVMGASVLITEAVLLTAFALVL
jgi:cobalamin synthase